MPISGKQTFPCPGIIRPMESFRSPLDGKTIIHDERQRRAHMREHDVEEAPPPVSLEEQRERIAARKERAHKEAEATVAQDIKSAIEKTGFQA